MLLGRALCLCLLVLEQLLLEQQLLCMLLRRCRTRHRRQCSLLLQRWRHRVSGQRGHLAWLQLAGRRLTPLPLVGQAVTGRPLNGGRLPMRNHPRLPRQSAEPSRGAPDAARRGPPRSAALVAAARAEGEGGGRGDQHRRHLQSRPSQRTASRPCRARPLVGAVSFGCADASRPALPDIAPPPMGFRARVAARGLARREGFGIRVRSEGFGTGVYTKVCRPPSPASTAARRAWQMPEEAPVPLCCTKSNCSSWR
eukprot:scaffold137175_cov30-Tisochrysis_lutea.AAC.9